MSKNTGGRPRKTVLKSKIDGNYVLNSLAVAELLGCSDQKAMELMREGKIVSKFAGRGWLTTQDAVVAYLETK